MRALVSSLLPRAFFILNMFTLYFQCQKKSSVILNKIQIYFKVCYFKYIQTASLRVSSRRSGSPQTIALPRVVLLYADDRELLVSGLGEGGKEIAQHPAVVDVPVGTGHVVLFSNNPMYSGETVGSYSLVFNTILNFDGLDAGRKLAEK